ncbi:MAG: hypothetical protein ACREPA_05115, partial [Candidatus Dormibacteraceae bacterium]
RARALRQCGVADEPLTSLKRAQHLFALDGNPDGQASALVEEAKQLEAADELAAARKLCARALGLARDPLIKAEILARITLDSALLGYLPEAAEAAHEALELMPSRRDARAVATDQVFVIARLGLAEALSGDFRGGRRHLEQACRLAGRDKVGVVSAMLAHYLHGVVCARAGAHELALGEFDRAQAIADQVGRDDYVRLCHGARGEMLANLGRLRSAESELRDAGWLCNRWVDAAYFYFRTGQHQQAAEIYESDIARAAAREDPLERARAQALLGVCLLAMGPSTLGRRLLEQAARSHAIRGFNSRTPGIRLHLADVAFAEGDPDLGAGLLRQALAGARAGGARHFFAFEPDVTRRCLTRARELLIEPEFAADCQRRLSPALLDSQPAERLEVAPQSLLAGCGDGRIRADLERSLTSGRLTARGLRKLLDEYGLTWRESQVFVRYYLPDGGSGASSRQRRDLAAQLGIAEHTVRHHVNSIRGKLGLGAQRGMAAYRWAVSQDIISA